MVVCTCSQRCGVHRLFLGLCLLFLNVPLLYCSLNESCVRYLIIAEHYVIVASGDVYADVAAAAAVVELDNSLAVLNPYLGYPAQRAAVVLLLWLHIAVVGRVEFLAFGVSLYRCVTHGAAWCRKLGNDAQCALFLSVRNEACYIVGVHRVVDSRILLVVDTLHECPYVGAPVNAATAVKIALRQETAVELLYGDFVVEHS